jgi:hypothetical protein
MKRIPLLAAFILSVAASFAQTDPQTLARNSFFQPLTAGTPVTSSSLGPESIACDPNTFWAVSGTDVLGFTLNAGVVASTGTIVTGTGGSLAYCNNLNGGSPSPTFYSNKTTTKASYYNGTGWTTCPTPPVAWALNAGGYGDFLYYTAHDSVAFREKGIVRYTGSAYTFVYLLPDTSRLITVADVVSDESGNVWFFTGNPNTLVTDTLNVITPAGQFLKKFPLSLNTDNAYGCFMLNGTIYIGLGPSNPDHPNTLIPVTISGNSASAGSPITMPTASYVDLASCTPGSPMAINETKGPGQFQLYPNPVNDFLTVEFSGNPATSHPVILFNAAGERLFRGTVSGRGTIDLSAWPAGTYYLQTDNSCRKFIKQ